MGRPFLAWLPLAFAALAGCGGGGGGADAAGFTAHPDTAACGWPPGPSCRLDPVADTTRVAMIEAVLSHLRAEGPPAVIELGGDPGILHLEGSFGDRGLLGLPTRPSAEPRWWIEIGIADAGRTRKAGGMVRTVQAWRRPGRFAEQWIDYRLVPLSGTRWTVRDRSLGYVADDWLADSTGPGARP